MSLLGVLGVAQAQDGSFVIPSVRGGEGTDFAYWDYFDRPPGSTFNINYNYANPPGLNGLDGGRDDDGNPTTVIEDHDNDPDTPKISRATLLQTGAADAFVTSSGAIYSFSEVVKFEVPYQPSDEVEGMVTNVIFQTQTGGIRLRLDSVKLEYESAGVTHTINPVFKALDDPQTGAFSESVVCAFQWDLTGLNVREFTIKFASPDISMPLWEAQLDVVIGAPFVQELGYVLATRTRPLTLHGRPGAVDKNLPWGVDGRYFLQGDELNLLGDPNVGWHMTGWYYDGTTTYGSSLPLIFPDRDIIVTALYAPEDFATWRKFSFFHSNGTLGTSDDYVEDSISGPLVDHDDDGLNNAGEYAFAGDPYVADSLRTRPEFFLVEEADVLYPALRYRTNGRVPGLGDVVQTVRVSANDGAWVDNTTEPTTVVFQRELQPDGSELVTERTVLPRSSFDDVAMQVAWSVGGLAGEPLSPLPLLITTEANLGSAQVGTFFSTQLASSGGITPTVWSVAEGDIPEGMSLSEEGVLSGIPIAAGSASFTLRVTDALLQTETQLFSLSVSAYSIVNAQTLPPRVAGALINLPLQVSGGTAPFTWSVTDGDLPEGVSLTNGGVLTGSTAQTGAYQFTVQVQDANSLTLSKDFEWVIFDLEILTVNPLTSAVVNFSYNLQLALTGGVSPFTWEVTSGSLPTGITLSPAGLLSGSPNTAGEYFFTLEVTDAEGFSADRAYNLTVLTTAPAPVIDPVDFPSTTVGADFLYTVTASYAPTKYKITGLPKGIKSAVANGRAVLSGRASAPGTYQVVIVAENATGTSSAVTASLVVEELSEGLIGSFTALALRDLTANVGLGSLVTLTTTAKGSYTVKVKTGGATKSAKGFLASEAPQVQVNVNGQALALTLDADTNLVTGTHGAAPVSGWRMIWDKKSNPSTSREGYYTVALDLEDVEDIGNPAIPQGVGFASFTILPAGTLKVAGRSADGQAIVAATTLGPEGQVAVYASVYAKKGSLLGAWLVTEAESALPKDGVVSGSLNWLKPTTQGRLYPDAFGPVDLTVEGSWMGTASKRSVMEGLPDTGSLNVTFIGGGVEDSTMNPDVTGAAWTAKYKVDFSTATNPAKAALTLNKAKGSVTGRFTLTETSTGLSRKNVKMVGQVVKLADGEIKAAGYFLLPQIPTSGQKANATPILSGAFFVSQPAELP
jgi:hypothetical protein